MLNPSPTLKCFLSVLLFLMIAFPVRAADRTCKELKRFKAAEAHQGVAVDAEHFYAIANRSIGQYSKKTGKLVRRWKDSEKPTLTHMNGGVVVDGKLYCAHSSSPHRPAVSSIEIWDTKTLTHVASHSFGTFGGALNWIDRHDGFWWAVFAYYDPEGPNSVERTTLIKFDDKWRRLEAWVFPKDVLKRFAPGSNSGGSWGPDGLLYCTGHDHGELYALELPETGSVLKLVDTVSLNITGQGIAWDKSEPRTIYGISRPRHEVVISRILELQPSK